MSGNRDKVAPTSRARRRGPGRPKSADGEATRERILRIALRHFGRHGRGGASVRSIATDSGVTLATVLHHFGDKASLYDACVKRAHDDLLATRDRFLAVLKAATTPDDAVGPVVSAALTFALAQAPSLRVVMADSVMSGQLPPDLLDRLVLPTIERLAAVLAPFSRKSVPEIRLMAMSLFHLVSRYALTEPEELGKIVGVDGAGRDDVSDDVLGALEGHLTALVRGYLLDG